MLSLELDSIIGLVVILKIFVANKIISKPITLKLSLNIMIFIYILLTVFL